MKILLLIFLSISFLSFNQEKTSFRGPINDFEDLIPAKLEKKLTKKIKKVEEKTGYKLLVVTSKNLGKRMSVPFYLNKLYKQWEISKTQLTKMVVLFVSKEKTKVRLYVGSALSDLITKTEKQDIVGNEIRARIGWIRENYKGALKHGILSILANLK